MSVRDRVTWLWRDPVGSGVIAAGIVAGLSYLSLQWSRIPPTTQLQRLGISVLAGLLLVAAFAFLRWHKRQPKPKTLVFLSSGGTCRDPMAKAIAKKLLDARGLKQPVEIRAVGLGPLNSSKASKAARYVIKEMCGEDLLADHVPEMLTPSS